MSIEVMKQAMEALEMLARYENPETKIQVRKPKDGGPVTMYPHKVASDAATALRAAIEQHDQTSLELCETCGWKALIPGDGCLVCARQKAKPVAWMYDFLSDNEVIRDWVTQSQEDIKREHGFNVRPLYTAPRQWVGLTEDEIHHAFCYVEYETPNDWNANPERWCQQFARYLEQRLKEKNHAG